MNPAVPERPLDPPEKRYPRGRQVQVICIERNDDEIEVECEMDEGSVYAAHVVGTGVEVTLTADERENAEVSYSESLVSDAEAAREDAYDRRADR